MSDPVSNSSSRQGSEGPSTGSPGGSTAPGQRSQADARASEPRGGILDRLRHFVGGWRSSGSLRTDLAEVLAADADAGTDLSVTERTMIRRVLDLRELRIGDLMVPRADIVAVQKDISLGEILAVFSSAGHSRLVVYDDTLDDPIGMVHIRDLVAYLTQRSIVPAPAESGDGTPTASFNLKAVDLGTSLSASQLIRRLLFVPPSMPCIELLASMQASRIHLALVIDEYGGTDGIVSMEDIVEEIVGDIEDEHDEEEAASITAQGDGSYIADARASLEDVAEIIDPAFALGEEAEEVDTLGGLLVTLAGRVPVRGEIVLGPGNFEIEVLDADPRRVKRLRISPGGRENGDPASSLSSGDFRSDRDKGPGGEADGGLPPPAEQKGARRSGGEQATDAA